MWVTDTDYRYVQSRTVPTPVQSIRQFLFKLLDVYFNYVNINVDRGKE
jgi:hypothetical protein